MADDEELVDVDISEWKKLKVVELRRRVSELGLDTKGTKAELITRVEKYLNEQEADLLEEEDENEIEMDKEDEASTKEEETTPPAQPIPQKESVPAKGTSSSVIKIEYQPPPPSEMTSKASAAATADNKKPEIDSTGVLSDVERLKKRGERFGMQDNQMAKKMARSERFGTVLGKRSNDVSEENLEKMKVRADRFGTTGGSSVITKLKDEEKKKDRASRFNLAATDLPMKDRKENRLARFGTIA